MKLKSPAILADSENPFANCKLNSEIYAQTLSTLVVTYKDGFVLALNGKWGTGKTTFIEMWQAKMKKDGFKTLNFNAWENDFDTDPLIAIMSELKTLVSPTSRPAFKRLVKEAAVLTKHIVPSLLKTALNKYTGDELTSKFTDGYIDGTQQIIEEDIKLYKQKKGSLIGFKEQLSGFIEKTNSETPIVFIIDELDRCRPSYAVEVLEKIKHLFSVRGIVFVLAMDKEQLGHAIKGVYGSDQINSEEYLRRFIDLEFTMPQPDYKMFCEHLYDHFSFDQFFLGYRSNRESLAKNDKSELILISSILFAEQKLTLRQQEKIMAHARAGLLFFGPTDVIFPQLYVVLVYLKNYHTEFFDGIQKKKYTNQGLLDQFSHLVPLSLSHTPLRLFTSLEAKFLLMYQRHCDLYGDISFIDPDGNKATSVSSRIDSDNRSFVELLFEYEHDYNPVRSLTSMLEKINLIENTIS